MIVQQLLDKQKAFFKAGSCTMPDARLGALYCLGDTIENARAMLGCVLRANFPSDEAVEKEIRTVEEGQERWQKELLRLLATGWKKEDGGKPRPVGSILLLSAEGASFAHTMLALFAALAAGNTVLMNLDTMTGGSADCVRAMITETFEDDYVATTLEPAEDLKEMPFDLVFEAGSHKPEEYFGREGLRLFSRFGEEEDKKEDKKAADKPADKSAEKPAEKPAEDKK